MCRRQLSTAVNNASSIFDLTRSTIEMCSVLIVHDRISHMAAGNHSTGQHE